MTPQGRPAALAAAALALGLAGAVVLGVGVVAQQPDPPAPVAQSPTPPAPGPEPSAPPAPPPAPPVSLPRSVPVGVSIPALGLELPLGSLGLDQRGAMQVPADGASVGWYDQSPTPGERGPAVLAAHVTWDGRPAAFFDLARLAPGQQVAVARSDGTVVGFEVTAVDQYAKDDFPTLEVYRNTDGPELRLITCGGEVDDATGSHLDNVVVSARMVSSVT